MVPLDIPRPEDVEGIFNSPFVVMYWPMILGTLIFFVALARGSTWVAIPVIVAAAAIQVLRLGIGS